MLKIGDKVRVRKDLKLSDYIQGTYVTNIMSSKIGQVVTISQIFNEGIDNAMCYEIEELPTLGVAFTDGMFETNKEDL